MEIKVVDYPERKIYISQAGYCKKVVERFGAGQNVPTPITQEGYDSLTSYVDRIDPEVPELLSEKRKLVGSFNHLSQVSRPDICFALGVCSRAVATEANIKVLKRIARYLRQGRGLCYVPGPTAGESDGMAVAAMLTYSDSDFAGDKSTRKSVTGVAIFLGKNLVWWRSARQNSVSLSTRDAEIFASSEAARKSLELIHLIKALASPVLKLKEGVQLFRIDNVAAENVAKSVCLAPRLKHIDVRHFMLQDLVKKRVLDCGRIDRDNNPADGFTKVLDQLKFKFFVRELLRMYDFDIPLTKIAKV